MTRTAFVSADEARAARARRRAHLEQLAEIPDPAPSSTPRTLRASAQEILVDFAAGTESLFGTPRQLVDVPAAIRSLEVTP